MAENLTLQRVLEAFNAPINEEQAWAVCYQCARHLRPTPSVDENRDQRDQGSVLCSVDGASVSAARAGRGRELLRGHPDRDVGGPDVLSAQTVILGPDGTVSSVAGYASTG